MEINDSSQVGQGSALNSKFIRLAIVLTLGVSIFLWVWTASALGGQIQGLRAELDSLKRTGQPANSDTAEVAELRQRVVELEESNEELRRALEGMSHTLSISLAQIMRKNNPAEFEKQMSDRHRMICILNLKQIDGAKEQWAIDNKTGEKAIPTKSDLYGTDLYILGEPSCPANGVYSINAVNELPVCSIDGHSL